VAGRLEPREAAATLSQALTKETDSYRLSRLAQALSVVAGRLEAKEAAAVSGQAAAALTQALTKETDWDRVGQLALALSAVAGRLAPEEAAAVCSPAAAALTEALTRETDPYRLGRLPWILSVVAGRLEAKEAAAVFGQAAAALTQALTRTTNSPALVDALSAIILQEDPVRLVRRRQGGAAAVGMLSCPGSVLILPARLQSDLEPLPPPLPAQTLVDLLKHPFCVGEARRLVLEQLTRRYQRPFADQWDFVRFAHEQKLGLDLLTPLQRPGSQAAAR
jgi:hypothetical protein